MDSTNSISIDPVGNVTSSESATSLGIHSNPESESESESTSGDALQESQSQPILLDSDNQASDSNSNSNSISSQPATQSTASAQAQVQSHHSDSFPTSKAGKLAQDSLSPQIQGLVLYDLTNKPNSNLVFSPHTLKTILDLKLLGIGYERQRLTFTQIRGELSRKVADNVTVPALELSDGTNIIESWAIAEYLESQHPRGVLLFPSTSSKVFAQFLNNYGKAILAPNLGPLCQPGISKLLDPESKDYFINKKVGASKIERCSKLSSEEKQVYIEGAIKGLSVVDACLATEDAVYDPDATSEEIERRRKKGGNVGNVNPGDFRSKVTMPRKWLCKGEQPSHADFVLFGWYAFSRAAGPEIAKQIWQNSSNPLVKAWVNNLINWAGPEITDDFI